jgi:alpha-L-fucosidase
MKKNALFALTFLLLFKLIALQAAGLESASNALPRPTVEQARWQDYEVGIFYHYDVNAFKPGWNHRNYDDFPKPEIFNPTHLDMQQWMAAAKALGAKYAILTAAHGSGFMLWQSDAYAYGLKQSPWKNGQGDIVKEFVDACRSNDVSPGLYCHMRVNGWWQVDHPGFVNRGQGGDPALQAKYAAAKLKQVEELWGNYGPLAEIWFDGGMPDSQAGYDVLPYAKKLQPQAVVFGGGNCPVETIRWIGGETGKAAYPCWATGVNPFDAQRGSPDGKDWCPGEADVDLLGGGWMWSPDSDGKLLSLEQLMEIYYASVGNNCNLLINAAPGPDGLIPEAQLQRLHAFGQEIQRRFGKSLAETSGEGNMVELRLGQPRTIDHVTLMEKITEGERVREYVVEGKAGGEWQKIGGGTCIGHKRIERIAPIMVSAVRLRVLKSVGTPLIRKLAVYDTTAPFKNQANAVSPSVRNENTTVEVKAQSKK